MRNLHYHFIELKRTQDCICVRWSTIQKIYHIVTDNVLTRNLVMSKQFYYVEPLEPMVDTAQPLIPYTAVQRFTERLPWSQHQIYAISLIKTLWQEHLETS